MSPDIVLLDSGREIGRHIHLMPLRQRRRGFLKQFGLAGLCLYAFRSRAESFINQRTISSVGDKVATLCHSIYSRQVSLGSWTKIRVGCRCHFSDYGADIRGGPSFNMGFCSGNAGGTNQSLNLMGIAFSSTNAFGAYSRAIATPSNIPYYTCGNSNVIVYTLVGTTLGNGGGSDPVGSQVPQSAGAPSSADRYILVYEIDKGSPNYTGALTCALTPGATGPNALVDTAQSDLLRVMSVLSPTLPTGHSAGTSTTRAFSEATNALNAIFFIWNKLTAYVDLSDICVSVVA